MRAGRAGGRGGIWRTLRSMLTMWVQCRRQWKSCGRRGPSPPSRRACPAPRGAARRVRAAAASPGARRIQPAGPAPQRRVAGCGGHAWRLLCTQPTMPRRTHRRRPGIPRARRGPGQRTWTHGLSSIGPFWNPRFAVGGPHGIAVFPAPHRDSQLWEKRGRGGAAGGAAATACRRAEPPPGSSDGISLMYLYGR